jgi:hypothetical protein
MIIKVMPLFIKNVVMKMVFNAVGERTTCLTMSNLGAVQLPDAMKPFVTRFDFILSVPSSRHNNLGIISYDGKMYLNFIRNIREPHLEAAFYEAARALGLHLRVESNNAALEDASDNC